MRVKKSAVEVKKPPTEGQEVNNEGQAVIYDSDQEFSPILLNLLKSFPAGYL